MITNQILNTMRAIVNVNRNSNYAKLNGLTFEVSHVLTQHIMLLIPVKGTRREDYADFKFSEVTIIDFEEELQEIYKKSLESTKFASLYKNLQRYSAKKKSIAQFN